MLLLQNFKDILQKRIYGLTIVLGPSCGGKSRWAEYLMVKYRNVTYIATSETNESDHSWMKRIRIHRSRRPDTWDLIENPSDLSQTILSLNNQNILIDSLGGFVCKYLDVEENQWSSVTESLIQSIKSHDKRIIIVIEEAGWGVIPPTAIGILFRERLGNLSQRLQSISKTSWLVISGRAINITKIGVKIK